MVMFRLNPAVFSPQVPARSSETAEISCSEHVTNRFRDYFQFGLSALAGTRLDFPILLRAGSCRFSQEGWKIGRKQEARVGRLQRRERALCCFAGATRR